MVMKMSDLIISLTTYLAEFGDRDVVIDLLTENQSNIFEITGNSISNGRYIIDCDINDVKKFKKELK